MLQRRKTKSLFCEDVRRVVDRMPIISAVDLFLPGAKKIPEQVINCQKRQLYYEVDALQLDLLVSPEFLGAFVNNGRIYIQSRDRELDKENCMTLLPNGTLLLHLRPEVYRCSRLDGVKSRCCKQENKWVVQLPLLKLLREGGAQYDVTVEELRQFQMNVMVAWEPPGSDILSSSVAEFFKSHGLNVTEKKNKLYKHAYKDLEVPLIQPQHPDGSLELTSCAETYEWIGGIMVEVDNACLGTTSPFISMFAKPPFTAELHRMTRRLSISGLITDTQVLALVHEIARSLVQYGGEIRQCPWFALSLSLFPDTCCTWRGPDHGYLDSGRTLLTWIVFPDSQTWSVELVDRGDRCLPPFL